MRYFGTCVVVVVFVAFSVVTEGYELSGKCVKCCYSRSE